MNRKLFPALVAVAALAGCSQDSTAGGGTPTGSSPRPIPSASSSAQASTALDYNPRYGSNRFAAEAAVAVGRRLYSQGGQFWELNVRTDPLSLHGTYDATSSSQTAQPVRGATAVTVFMATESAASISAFRAGGVPHEKGEITDMAVLLQTLFPTVTTVSVQIFFGEANHYATATYSGGQLDLKFFGAP